MWMAPLLLLRRRHSPRRRGPIAISPIANIGVHNARPLQSQAVLQAVPQAETSNDQALEQSGKRLCALCRILTTSSSSHDASLILVCDSQPSTSSVLALVSVAAEASNSRIRAEEDDDEEAKADQQVVLQVARADAAWADALAFYRPPPSQDEPLATKRRRCLTACASLVQAVLAVHGEAAAMAVMDLLTRVQQPGDSRSIELVDGSGGCLLSPRTAQSLFAP